MAPQPNQEELQRIRARILEEVIRSTGARLQRQARRFAGEDADDAVEDACIAFLRYYRPEPDGNPAGWMMTTVKHAALAIGQRNATRRRNDATPANVGQVDGWWMSSLPDMCATVEEQVEDRDWVRSCSELLGELKPDERTALALIAFGFSYQEICARQGWSSRKLERCAVEGRARLRHLLALRGEET